MNPSKSMSKNMALELKFEKKKNTVSIKLA
jgi:hypothetical protein